MKKTIEIILYLLVLWGTVQESKATGIKGAAKTNTKKFTRLKAKADKSYEAYSYEKAIYHYKRALKANRETSVELRLADSYRLLNQPEEAELWYRAVLDEMTMSDNDMLNFGQVLSANGKYDEALAIYEQYQHHEDWVDDHVEALSNVERFYVNEIAYEIEESLFNSLEKDFSPALKKDGVVFVTGRPSSGVLKPEYSWDGSNFLDLFIAKDGETPEKIHRGINTRYHEGPAVFYDNDTKMFFTRNNYHKKRAGASADGVNKLKLYYSERKDEDRWNKPQEFPYNDDHHSTGHPAITSDGKTLYFASDRPGGFGGVDLYKCELINGQWSQPENLGKRFNTAEDEMFPFLHEDEILYFTSTGHEGLGGLDLFRANLSGDHSPRNMGFPLNTNADDFGIAIENGTNTGYFSSNRVGGTGDDDIYNVHIFDYIIHVNLIDGVTQEPLSGSILVNETLPPDIVELWAKTEDATTIKFRSLKGSKFEVDGTSEGYLPGDIKIEPEVEEKENAGGNQITHLYYDLPLYPIDALEAELIVVENNGSNTQVITFERESYQDYAGTLEELRSELGNEGKKIVKETYLKNIFYDFDKYNIRADAAAELNELYQFLMQDDKIDVSLSSHTDVRGSVSYNETLAANRAKAAQGYLIEKGIEEGRL
ncbi:MAG: OmpA family protein, partial [Bacteroidota bacterium]